MSSRWALSFIGLLALSLLIWFGGPLVSIAGREPLASHVQRLVALLVLTFTWAVINIGRQLRHKQKNEKAVKTLLDGDDDASMVNDASKREIDLLRSRITQALSVLSSSSLTRNKSVYQLPWYILIGPPGTGKTTALYNSGLEFPLKDKLGEDPLAGVGGTRHCDWWFTNKAVLIDTAGRYTTQDSNNEQDSRGWLGFLGLLKKHRARRPINGAIVTVSLVSLLTQTHTERNLHARAIKQRIQELKNQLGMHLPVYIVLTKADLVAGFNEFFSDLSVEQREQVWGITFPEHPDDRDRGVVGLFNKEFHFLLESLTERVNIRLKTERDIEKRTLIYEFPKQLKLLQAATDDFLKEIFSPNTFEEAPMLRGVYIVSATQDGVPIDRVMAQTSADLGLGQVALQQSGGAPKGFFIKRLFEDVIVPEQYLGTVNRYHKRQHQWFRLGVVGACCLSTALIGSLWLVSYRWNKGLIDQSDTAVQAYQQLVIQPVTPDTDAITLVNVLDALKDLPAGFSGYMVDTEEYKRAGLYQGDKIGQPAKAAYVRGLQKYLAPYLASSLQSEMQLNQEYLEYLYETLKAYLMLFDKEHYEEAQVLSWFALYFERNYPGDVNKALRWSLAEHTANLLNQGNIGIHIDDEAVQTARGVLTQMPLAERAYQRLKLEFLDSPVPDFTLTDVLGIQGSKIFERRSGKLLSEGISGLYTYNGFHSVFQLENQRIVKRLMEDSWVYGDELQLSESTKTKVADSVSQKYYRDYVYEWTQLLADIRLKPYRNAEEGLQLSKVLSGTEQPVESLILAAQKQLRLTDLPVSENAKAAGEVAGHAAKVAMAHKKARINRYLPNELPSVDFDLPGKSVEQAFASILALNEGDLNTLNESFVQLHNFMVELSSTGNNDKVAYKSLLGGDAQGSSTKALSRIENTLPPPFEQWMEGLSQQTSKLAKKGSKTHINTLWQEKVVSQYRTAIEGKYPFNSRARGDVKLKDFGRFFGYNGVMDRFFIAYLEPFVDTSRGNWRFVKNIGVSEESLRSFEQARRIRDAFFEPGTQSPRIEFAMKTLYLDKHISNFKLELGRQSLTYRHGPTRSSNFSWPEKSATSKVRLVFTPPLYGHSITKTYEGNWGLFRMLDEAARHRPQTRKDHLVQIEHKGNRATVELVPTSVVHPFWMKDLAGFSCPTTL
ncbi:type VI secretion system protein ImpL [Photobacterium lutimaris]|nr:type VI secretion system protein ImpL [Photobacterium lutimaris]